MASEARSQTPEAFVVEVIDNGQVTAQQFLVVALCLFFNMLDGFDITAMAVVAGAVSSDLGLEADRLGWIFSFALLGMMAGAMFLAPVSDIIGRRKTIIIGMLIVGTSVLLTALASTLAEFVVLRFLSGLGAGAMMACQATLAAEYSPDRFRSLSVAAVMAGYPLGAMVTSVIAGTVMPRWGWPGMFVFGGVLTLSMVAVAWFLLPESLKFLFERRPPGALMRINAVLRQLGREPLDGLPARRSVDASPKAGLIATMLELLSREHVRTTLTLWSTFFLSFAALYFLMSWIPKLMEDAGYSAATGREAFFLFNLGGVVGIFVMGLMATRWKLTDVVFALLFLSAAGMTLFAAAPDNLPLLFSLIFLVGLLQQGGFVGLYAAAAKAYPTQIRSTGIGWAIGLGRSGAVAGPAVAGYLIAAGLDMSANFYIFALPMAISGIVAYRLHIR